MTGRRRLDLPLEGDASEQKSGLTKVDMWSLNKPEKVTGRNGRRCIARLVVLCRSGSDLFHVSPRRSNVSEVNPDTDRGSGSRGHVTGTWSNGHPSAVRKDDHGISPSRGKGANFLRAPCAQRARNYIYLHKLSASLGPGKCRCRR